MKSPTSRSPRSRYKKATLIHQDEKYLNQTTIMNWSEIYLQMMKDIHLKKILKKNDYHLLQTSEINEATQRLQMIPLKDTLKVIYFTDFYQKHFEEYLRNEITADQLINLLNFPQFANKKPNSDCSSIENIEPIKRLQIKDIKKTIERLNEITKEKKKIKSRSLHNPVNSFDSTNTSKIQNNEKNEMQPEFLKHQIIQNMLLERFLERKKLKKERFTNSGGSNFRPSTPKVIKSFINVEKEFIAKIKTKNINHLDSNHSLFYLKNDSKLSDSHLLRQTHSHHYDPTSIKKLREDNKAKNILDSNLKYQIDLTADEYIESLKKFKDLSREYNNKIVLKEKLKDSKNKFPRFSLKPLSNMLPIDSSFSRFRNTVIIKNRNTQKSTLNEKQISFQDYMHFSDLIKKHKEGSAPLLDVLAADELNLEKLNTCCKYQRNIERKKVIEEREENIKKGRIKRKANCSFIELNIQNKSLKREKIKSVNSKKNDDFYLHEHNLDNDDDNSLRSLTENKLDKLYNESQMLQKKIADGENTSLADRMKKIIRLEKLNRLIIDINKKKLNPEI